MNIVDLCSVLGIVLEFKIGKTACSLKVKFKLCVSSLYPYTEYVEALYIL